MRSKARIIFIILILLLIVAQFFQPEKNSGEIDNNDLFSYISDIPDDIGSIIKTSCYDCHSNQTNYPWYSRISPLSWYLNKHIESGKHELNFSEYGDLSLREKLKVLQEVCEVVEEGSMPLKSYLLIHEEAKLTGNDVELLCSWIESESERILGE